VTAFGPHRSARLDEWCNERPAWCPFWEIDMRVLRAVVLFALSALLSSHAAAGPYSGVYFFGDSLTDTGNVTTLYATLPHPPGAPAAIPGPPYDPGGRASNGPLYADVLANGLGFSALASERGGTNYAFGGARTRYQLFGPPFPGIVEQVTRYRAQPGAADPNALYVVWGGSNNLQDIFLGRTVDPLGQPIPTLGQTVADLAGVLNGLYDEGARHLLVPNVPNLGRVPRVRELGGPPAQAAATSLVQGFNGALGGMLDAFQAAHPDASLIRFDSYATFEGVVATAPLHGIVNLTDRCYTGDDLGFTGGGSVCANPDQYLFWDGIHPTTIVHQLLGQAVLQAALVPEPASVVLMGVGLAVLVLCRRARFRSRPSGPGQRKIHARARPSGRPAGGVS
jgi:phospholipase/lecithinase/hemolysin